jgi:hypothetical protein
VRPSCWQRAIALAARLISALSRILVLANTVRAMILRPGAIQYVMRMRSPPQ